MKFEIAHEVVLDRPLDEVFPVLALAPDLERVLGLSPMLKSFRLLDERPGPTPTTLVIDFEFVEQVPLLGRLYETTIPMRCEQTVDTETHRVDYRSRSTRGVEIRVHKVRTFTPAPRTGTATGTVVREVIHGEAPPGLHLVARRSARRQHRLHMDQYAGLFAQPA